MANTKQTSENEAAESNADWENSRCAGVLLSITSLPSLFGIGDFGPEAYAFADFLSRSKQRYWQLLPVNPTESAQGYSPYSSLSSMAGSTLLISPELLLKDKLLTANDVEKNQLQRRNKINFEEATRVKDAMLEKAWGNFQKKQPETLVKEFKKFTRDEGFWLDDFSLFIALKNEQDGKPWYEWPEEFKLRDENTVSKFRRSRKEEIEKYKWWQFIFFRQWRQLRDYCNERNVQLFGDLPFYVSYDSADVWSNREIFSLDKEGRMIGVAGVPPDYFNEDGQLWGMPVFKWEVLKRSGYSWWINRIRKNMELFDLLRLDHFRAFADYWEVPASENTARNGEWKPGPGKQLFRAFEKALGDVPFVAEDLGDINEAVYELRDEFDLPGMVVLQFAFGDSMPQSIYIPHNYVPNAVAYTGTHDNNTTVGWFRTDATKTEKANIAAYTGKKASEKDIHVILARLAYSSVANTVIIPMQDILGLDESARMNKPASPSGNWNWRLQPKQITKEVEAQLRMMTELYNRDGQVPE